uniref:Uncharacterized protein n=1 Tax=Panagrolaimus superbus TaxID=310955 RepID=A0A914YN98_9BILA
MNLYQPRLKGIFLILNPYLHSPKLYEHARHGEEYDRQDLNEEYQNNNDGIILIDEIENVPVEPEHAASSASLEFVCETPENSRVMKSAFGSTFKVPNKTAKELNAQDAEQLLIRQKKRILITLLKNLLLMGTMLYFFKKRVMESKAKQI